MSNYVALTFEELAKIDDEMARLGDLLRQSINGVQSLETVALLEAGDGKKPVAVDPGWKIKKLPGVPIFYGKF